MRRTDWGKLALTSALGLLLSYAFVFLAALPLRYQRLQFGRTAFWLVTLSLTAVLVSLQAWQWAIVYLSLSALIGLYRELEECRTSVFMAGLASVGITSLVSGLAIMGYTRWIGVSFKSLLLEKASPFIEQMQKLPRFQETEMDIFIWYLPSGLIITFMVVLFMSLTLSRQPGDRAERQRLLFFSLPDWAIWFFIGSLAAAFIPEKNSWVALLGTNFLVVVLAAYFFQGLAVTTVLMDFLRVGGFVRMVAYFLIFFQMFIFVSGVGILDYWFDFRSSLAKRQLKRLH